MQEMIRWAAKHKGTAFIEIYQNCNIFNDGAFELLTEKDTKADNVVVLEHGKPLVFGKNKEKGIKLDGFTPKVIDLTDGKNSVNDCLVHDENDADPIRAFILAHMTDHPGMPTPIGIIRQIAKETYDEGVDRQIKHITEKKGAGTIEKLLFSGSTWEVN
jgi:2-oxoglutarate ferredoxin oxidoreductase subunit beta